MKPISINLKTRKSIRGSTHEVDIILDVLEVLYDHYKETCELSREAQKRRNRGFIGLCFLEAASFLMLIKPAEVTKNIFENILKGQLDISIELGDAVFQTLLWIAIIYVMMRYIQDTLYVERQYPYIDSLEKKMPNLCEIDVFVREGENYQRNYPMVLNFIDLFYEMLAPILFLTINTIRIVTEWQSLNNVTASLTCDTILYTSLFIITWFYFFEIHSKITSWFKKHVKIVDRIARLLRKWLKEV